MSTDPGPGKAKPKVSPARNVIGLVLLVVFGGAAVAELMAYRGHSSAITTLQGMLPKDDKGRTIEDPYTKVEGRPTQAAAEKAIGLTGAPAKLKDDGVEQYATYNWKGLFRAYKLNVYYTKDTPPALVRVSTEDGPR